jgi:hypothetical protein
MNTCSQISWPEAAVIIANVLVFGAALLGAVWAMRT